MRGRERKRQRLDADGKVSKLEREYERKIVKQQQTDGVNNEDTIMFGLPIKKNSGELVPHVRKKVKDEDSDASEDDDNEKKKKKKKKKKNNKEKKNKNKKNDEKSEHVKQNGGSTDIANGHINNDGKLNNINQILNDDFLRSSRQQECLQEMATISIDIVSDPVVQITKLKTIMQYCKDADSWVQKRAILSVLALFKDLIPDYKINVEHLEQEISKSLSKEVGQRRFFESNLIKQYQYYLQFLDITVKKSKHSEQIDGSDLLFICAKSMCELLVHAPHFNYRSNIIEKIIPLMNSPSQKIRTLVFDHVTTIFTKDMTHGEVSLELVEEITQFIVKKQYQVSTELIDCLLSLPLRSMLKDTTLPTQLTITKKKGKKNSKKEKQSELSFEEELERDMKIAEGSVSESQKKKYQTEMLRNIIVCYVRLLKMDPSSKLLFCALAGLSKFSHLMNIELLYDLLDYLKSILNNGQEYQDLVLTKDGEDGDDNDATVASGNKFQIPLETVLQSLITTAKLMQGMGSALNIDIKDFYNHLYDCIPKVVNNSKHSSDEKYIHLLIDALYFLLLRSTQKLSDIRVAAFMKRLCHSIFHCPLHTAISLLTIVQQLSSKYPSAHQQLLSGEECGLGMYNQETSNPDQANAFSTSLWELISLQMHFHPHVRNFCANLLDVQKKGAPLAVKHLTSLDLHDIYSSYDPSEGRFNPPVTTPNEHPLQAKYEKLQSKLNETSVTSKKKKKINPHVFVQPSTYAIEPSLFIRELNLSIQDYEKNEIDF